MKCPICWKEFYNPFVKSNYCSQTCENKDKIKQNWDEFIKNFFWWFMNK